MAARTAPKKTNAKKPAATRKPGARTRKPKKNNTISTGKILKYSFLLLFISFIVVGGYRYRHAVLYYLGFTTNKRMEALTKEERKIADLRIYEIVGRNKGKAFGIDVSHYQGSINWDSIDRKKGDFPLDFVFIRATQGKDGTDEQFSRNWKHALSGGFMRGAYHYYRPDENSVEQAENFIKNVRLRKGDLPPVLDIEKIPAGQSMDSLKTGLKRWLGTIERYYGVKPILYSGERYYTDFLKEEFKGYTVWIAHYSSLELGSDWHFWQFTDKAAIKGIDGTVDVNIYNGTAEALQKLRIK
jgi:lysozyme